MEKAAMLWLEAELTKINFILEAAWANMLLTHGAAPEDVDELSIELLRQFRTLPGTMSDGRQAPANDEALREMAAERVATFFEHVRRRVGSAQGQTSPQ